MPWAPQLSPGERGVKRRQGSGWSPDHPAYPPHFNSVSQVFLSAYNWSHLILTIVQCILRTNLRKPSKVRLRVQLLCLNGSKLLLRVSVILDPERCSLLLLPGISTEWATDCFEGRRSFESQAPFSHWNHFYRPSWILSPLLTENFTKVKFSPARMEMWRQAGSQDWDGKLNLAISAEVLLHCETHTSFVRELSIWGQPFSPKGQCFRKKEIHSASRCSRTAIPFNVKISSCTWNHMQDFWKLQEKGSIRHLDRIQAIAS